MDAPSQAMAAGRSRSGTSADLIDIPAALIVIDENQRFLAVNDSANALFGYATGELLGKPVDILLPEHVAESHHHHVATFSEGTIAMQNMSASRALLGRHRDGHEFPVEVTIGKTMFRDRRALTALINDVSESRLRDQIQLQNREKLEVLLRHATDGVVVVDTGGIVLFASPTADRIMGVPTGRLIGTSSSGYVLPGDFPTVALTVEEARTGSESSAHLKVRVLTGDGRWIWIEATISRTDGSLAGGYVTNFRDVTEELTVQSQREAVADFGLWALQGAPEQELMRRATEVTAEFLGTDSTAVYESMTDGTERAKIRAAVGWLQHQIGTQIQTPPRSPAKRTLTHGTPFVVDNYAMEPPFPGQDELEAAGVRSSLGAAIQGEFAPWGMIGATSHEVGRFSDRDVAFMQAIANVLASAIRGKQAEAEFADRALHDDLTGLPNRALLKDRIEFALAATLRSPDLALAVLFVDLDNFKRTNDTLGHDTGDELLRQVGSRLRRIVRTEDTVARFGGDEFIITHLQRRADDPGVLADRILTEMRVPFHLHDTETYVTASIGVAVSDPDDCSSATLLRDADTAMYEAKHLGRDRYAISGVDQLAPLVVRANLELDLHHALERDQLSVHFQPVIDSDTGLLVGSEALLRWNSPGRGAVSPSEFIPIAEESGQIVEIGRWVLLSACRQLAQWQRTHGRTDLGVSVNLSPRQLADPTLISSIEFALASTGLAPSALRVEITETMVVQDLERATSTLKSIAALGVGLVIDDFGTGYSSLTYLKTLPLSSIKVDRSFIVDIVDNVADQAIVAAVASLASRLNLTEVAEGVETSEQLAAVRSLGCKLIQGFYYSPALSAREFEASWLDGGATIMADASLRSNFEA